MTPRSAPIADVAGASAAQAALEEVAGEMADARREGRLVARIKLEAIDEAHLVRDRIDADETEMDALIASLRSRGQQTPLEIVDLGKGTYGLISGWRRLVALRRLRSEGVGDGTALCLIRAPQTATDAYIAMVEENEIRAGLSFYERARIAARAAEQGAYPTGRYAVKGLFANATASKRSKIVSFLSVYETLDDVLKFPSAISERLGLALVKAIESDGVLLNNLRANLKEYKPDTAEAELASIEAAMKDMVPPTRAELNKNYDELGIPKDKRGWGPTPAQVAAAVPGVSVKYVQGKITLTGQDVSEGLREDLEMWLLTRSKK